MCDGEWLRVVDILEGLGDSLTKAQAARLKFASKKLEEG